MLQSIFADSNLPVVDFITNDLIVKLLNRKTADYNAWIQQE
jgi:hypothetical protein